MMGRRWVHVVALHVWCGLLDVKGRRHTAHMQRRIGARPRIATRMDAVHVREVHVAAKADSSRLRRSMAHVVVCGGRHYRPAGRPEAHGVDPRRLVISHGRWSSTSCGWEWVEVGEDGWDYFRMQSGEIGALCQASTHLAWGEDMAACREHLGESSCSPARAEGGEGGEERGEGWEARGCEFGLWRWRSVGFATARWQHGAGWDARWCNESGFMVVTGRGGHWWTAGARA